jgi:O-antigen/teichoic acid export membrane protein
MSTANYDDSLKRGAAVNMLGLVGKLLYPLLFLVITWLCGPERVGLYLLAVAIAEIGAGAVQSGFVDAILIYASRHVDQADTVAAEKDKLYLVLGTAFGIPLVLSLVLALVTQLGAGPLVAWLYEDRPMLAPGLRIVGWTLPFIALSQSCIAATKARMRMEYDAVLNGFARAVLLLAFSALFWKLSPELASLMWAQLATYVVLAALSLWAYLRHFELAPLLSAIGSLRVDRDVVRFAIPQNLNMTFNKYLTRLDVMMLGALGHSDFELGLFGAAALISSNIREVKLIFSGALGPVVARHHALKRRQEIEDVLGRVTRWSTTIAVPIVLLVAALRTDLLRLVDASYADADNAFMIWLLVTPLLSCAFGLAGNCIVYTGHSSYNLLNSVSVAVLNTGFNYLMIPRWGLTGAAIATATASGLVTLLQLFELRMLEGIGLRARAIYKPNLGLIMGAGLIAWAWDPAQLAPVQRAGLATTLVLSFLGLMLALRHEEVLGLARRLVARRA